MIDTVIPLLASLGIAVVTLAYTPPNSTFRPLAGIVIAGFNWIAAQSTISRWFPGLIGPEYVLGWILACNNWLNLAQVHYQPKPEGKEEPHARLRWAIYQIFDTRWSVSSSQMPLFDKHNPQWTPSRRFFLLWKTWTITWCGLLLYTIKQYDFLQVEHIVSIPVEFLSRLPDLSREELFLRIYYGLIPTISSYACLCLMHAVCGFIAVAIFQDDPAGWRPLHGSPFEALGMRGFYNKFWHQIMRKGFTTHAVFFVNSILRFPRKSPVSRYLIVVLTFAISGFYHASLTPEFPFRCRMQQMRYQMSIVGAIIVEDIIAMAWNSFAPRSLRLYDESRPLDTKPVTTSTSTALSSDNDSTSTDLRRRAGKADAKDESTAQPVIQPITERPQDRSKPGRKWTQIALHGIIYLWTIAFLIWANSTLVWSSNRCMLDAVLGDDIQTMFGVVPSGA